MIQMPWLSPPHLFKVRHRADRVTVDDDLIMAMRTSSSTGRSLVADDLALFNGLACKHGRTALVARQGLAAVAMVQSHGDTVTPVPAGELHPAVSCRADRCAI